MSDIRIRIQEGSSIGVFNLIDQKDGSYKLDHPLADPDRIFYKNSKPDATEDLVLYALMHLCTRK